MFIGVKELGRHDLRFREEFQPDMVDFRLAGFRQAGPLRVEASAELDGDDILLTGHLRGTFRVSCSRCLGEVVQSVERDFAMQYRPVAGTARDDELKLGATDLDIGFYRGDGFFLADAVAELVSLAMPVKPLCDEECRGLCPGCGASLDRDACRCDPQEADPRWSGLAGWKAGKAKS